jgi:hypothetical protein
MKKAPKPLAAARLEPHQDEIRDYAFHLYVQGGCHPGHDLEDWLEAKACILAHIPKENSRARLHHQSQPDATPVRAIWQPMAATPAAPGR